MFSLFQIAHPAWFALALGTPLLILAYLRRRTARRTVVSSVQLLKLLPKHSIQRRRFRPPLSFFFELLALLLLVAALTRPVLRDADSRVAIILDSSLSMLARDGSTPDAGATRFAAAKKQLSDWLDRQAGGARFSLFTSAPTLQRHGAELASGGTIKGLLANLTPALSADSLATSVEELARSGSFDQLLVVTDRATSLNQASPDDADSTGAKTVIRELQVGDQATNVFVRSIRVETDAVRRGWRRVVAGIGLSGPRSIRAQAAVIGFDRAGGSKTNIGTQRVTLSPDGVAEVRIDVPPARRNLSSFRLSVEASKDVNFVDAVPDDNIAWETTQHAAANTILLITATPAARGTLGLENISGVSVSRVSPNAYARLNNAELEEYSLLVFHQTAPVITPPVSSLLILPPSGNRLFPIRDEVVEPVITSWASTHPITAYLRVSLLQPRQTTVLDVPSWAQSVINIEQGSLLVAGESRGVRFVGVGTELLPFEGKRTPLLSVLTLNLVRWLNTNQQLGRGFRTGGLFELAPNATWVIAAPDKSVATIETDSSSPGNYQLDAPGVYSLTRISGDSSDSLSRKTSAIAANVFFPQESATFFPHALQVHTHYLHDKIPEDDRVPLWPLLIQIALAMLVIEMLLRVRQQRREVAA